MLVAGSIWPANWWGVNQSGYGPMLGVTASGIFFTLVILALSAYPSGTRRSRAEKLTGAAAAICFLPAMYVFMLISPPDWNAFAADAHWPDVWESRTAFDVASTVISLAVPTILVVAFILLRRRMQPLSRLESRVLRPSLLGLILASTSSAVVAVILYIHPVQDMLVLALVVQNVGLLLVPAAMLRSLLHRESTRSAVADLVLRLSKRTSAADVEQALRETLQDEELKLFFSVEDGTYVDVHGVESKPTPGSDGVLMPVVRGDGSPLATVSTSARLDDHFVVVEAALRAAGLALENARLEAHLRAQLDEVSRSRARIVEVQLEERRRLERDLHDGAQQRLLALALRLEAARQGTAEEHTNEAILRAKAELLEAHAEIRELARGINPGALAQSGLVPALEELTERLPLAVHLDVCEPRLAPAVESALYFVACEALANTMKHAEAQRVDVVVRCLDGRAELLVRDDGVGGAHLGGSGLRGLSDRLRALGGDLHLEGHGGSGTTVRAWVPCA